MKKLRISVVCLVLLTSLVMLMSGCDTEGYTLTIAVNPSGGGTTSPALGIHDYDDGTDVNVSATAAAGYVFDHWSGAATGVTTSVSITMTANKSITANFVPTYHLVANVLPGGAGEVTLSGESPYKEDTEVTLNAIPSAGYVFDHWSGAITGGTNPITLTMDANKTVTAHFTTTVMYTLTIIVDPLGEGTVEISPLLGSYEPGTTVTLEAIPDSGNTFLYWEGDLSGNTNPITVIMDSNKEVTAKIDCG